jgi:predicted PurR-regulated permease PerM
MAQTRTNAERRLGMAVLLLLLGGCLLVLRPFLFAMLWAVVLCCASWPLYDRLVRLLGQRRSLAALLMMLGMVIILLLPFIVVGLTLADNVKELTAAAKNLFAQGPPAPPEWLAKIPIVGQRVSDEWRRLAADTATFWRQAQQWIEPLGSWLLKVGLAIGAGLIELALSIFIAFFLFRHGAGLAAHLTNGIEQIAGARGKELLDAAARTVRGVVYGILGTALVQAVLAGIGFVIAGVPGPALLALLSFFFSVVPLVGTGLVWIPAALWLLHQGSTGWSIFMVVWGVGVANVDNVVKPWLISQGSDMPFILIFFGVLGGALTFGFIGVFLGPTLLAVGWRLAEEWASSRQPAPQLAKSNVNQPLAAKDATS